MSEKYMPKIGEHLYLSQRTGHYYVDMVKTPYTVIDVSNSCVTVQECNLIFNQDRYFDTIADEIEEDPEGEILKLHYSPKAGRWQIDKYNTGYPDYAFFGEWKHQPYLD